MNLFAKTSAFLRWYVSVLLTYLRARPTTTIALVLCAVGSRVTHMLTRLLPIKVILLAGSDGVPSYFRPFLAPDQKTLGLVVLTLAAIACYCADFVLDAIAERLSQSGSRHVVKGANEIVLSDQLQQAQSSYSRVMGLTANLVFAVIGFATIAMADLWLVGFLLGFFCLVFLASALALRGNIYAKHRPIAAFIMNDTGTYLSVLSIVSFIAAFLFIISPFITGGNANVLVAMVAITFLRRTLSSITSSTRMAISLMARVHQVNALIFREHRVARPERTDKRTLRETFEASNRLNLVREDLGRAVRGSDTVQTVWSDPVGGVQNFFVQIANKAGIRTAYFERVFHQTQLKKLDNEEFLFQRVPMSALAAPHSLGRFEHKPFQVHMARLEPDVRPITREEWRDVFATIVEGLWARTPPDDVVRAYRMSQPLLHERLTDEFIARASLAVDTPEAGETYKTFSARLEGYRSDLASVPLYINNPLLNRNTVMIRGDGSPVILDWSAWRLDLIGAGYIPRDLPAVLERVAATRSDWPEGMDAERVRLVARFAYLERLITGSRFRSAVELMQAIITGAGVEFSEVAEESEDGADLGLETEPEDELA